MTNFGHKFNMREVCMKKVSETLNEDQKLARNEVCFEMPRNMASNREVGNPCIAETKVSLSVEMHSDVRLMITREYAPQNQTVDQQTLIQVLIAF